MKALILNSGLGHRMGELTAEHPKCMTLISKDETILSRQLKQLASLNIDEVVMTTGYYDEVLCDYVDSLSLPIKCTFVKNPVYDTTNYIYSIYCAKEHLDGDILLMHGDLVFEDRVLIEAVNFIGSCMTVSSTLPLPEKDFKAVIHNGKIDSVGIEFFDDALAAQPLYKLKKEDFSVWLNKICEYCESGNTKCYAENAFNEVSDSCIINPLDVKDELCAEIDTPEDLATVSAKLDEINGRTVYICFSTDMIHSGHISIINKAKRLGKLTVGVLSDEAIASFKRFPLMPFDERKLLFENINGVSNVVKQETLSYADVLQKYRPTFVVHGDDWKEGFQKPVRDEVIKILSEYGGTLVEYPYQRDAKYEELEKLSRAKLSMPDVRRGRLKKLINL